MTPVPEPVEVPADELGAAEQRMRELAADWGDAGDLQAFAGREPYWTCARHAAVLLAEYERRGQMLDAWHHDAPAALAWSERQAAEIARLGADLARALPVVEAAGAVAAEWPRLASSVVDGLDHNFVAALNALAYEVRKSGGQR